MSIGEFEVDKIIASLSVEHLQVDGHFMVVPWWLR